jgi:transcription initiation factor TFIIH subunit 2
MRADGLASLQNILLLSMSILRHIPDYGCREVIILYTSLSTCDPSDIFSTIEVISVRLSPNPTLTALCLQEVKKMKIRCSVICLSAEIYVCKKLTEMTNGTFSVATDFLHLNELLSNHITPPADLKSTISNFTDFIYMGFPKRQFETLSSFCYDGRDIIMTSTAYLCPRCHCHVSEIPSLCPICSLQLNSSSHIARSYHHLFPVTNYEEIGEGGAGALLVGDATRSTTMNHSATDPSQCVSLSLSCYGCLESLSSSSLSMRCVHCQHSFCVDCDLFIHNSLHNCPGCD